MEAPKLALIETRSARHLFVVESAGEGIVRHVEGFGMAAGLIHGYSVAPLAGLYTCWIWSDMGRFFIFYDYGDDKVEGLIILS